ncbi:MAG: T-cell receptor beta chain V region [Paludibacteraceae bacterium]|nr:T-cell receptor beta chain V region [Paludibacteraceae bacterium]
MKKTQYMAPQTVSMQIQSAVSLCVVLSGGGGDTSFFGIGAAGDAGEGI